LRLDAQNVADIVKEALTAVLYCLAGSVSGTLFVALWHHCSPPLFFVDADTPSRLTVAR
jgi:hypothetical protein